MRRCLLFLFMLTMFSPALCKAERGGYRKASKTEANVSWQFDIKNDRDGNPQGKVYLLVNGRKVLILRDAAAQYSVLEHADYKARDVPAKAITACTGWWAGQGEDLYVIRRRNQLIVYIRYLDEGVDTPAYRRLKVIPLR